MGKPRQQVRNIRNLVVAPVCEHSWKSTRCGLTLKPFGMALRSIIRPADLSWSAVMGYPVNKFTPQGINRLAWPEDGEIWFSYCAKLRDVALSMAAVSEVFVAGDTLAQPKVFAAALLSRSLLSLRGVLVTAKAGLVAEAGTLSRSCVECSLWKRQLHQDGEGFSKAILDDSEHNMADLARKIPAAVLSGSR